MTDVQLDCSSEPDRMAVRGQLDRIMNSAPFRQSRRRQRFLEYLVSETLAGRSDRLKAYTVAIDVFERPKTFDPLVDPLVRIEAGRLRDKLREYYEADGRDDPIRIDLPKGSYAPHIAFQNGARSDTAPHVAAATADAPLERPAPGPPADALETPQHASGTAAESSRSELAKFALQHVALLAAAVVLVIAAGFWISKGRTTSPTLMPGKPAVAVLPFSNIGNDPKWARFADGMTEDIITDLSHSKDLLVIARTSTEVYRDKAADVRQIGRDLKVRYVLEGSIQAMGERIRVTAQLIESASGSHVWSERYDRPADDLFAVQNDVTQSIAATLGGYEGAVADAERRLVRRKPPASLTAFDTYLLAMEAKHKVTKEGLAEAEVLFNKALALDPQLARAYVGLVDTQFYLIDLGLAPSVEEAVAKMAAAGEKAVAIDPEDAKTHYALGLASAYQGKLELAATEFARAETLAPSDADLLIVIAWSYPALGQTERAVTLAERSLKLNPHYPDWYNQGLSYVFFFGGQFDRAVKYRLLVKAPLAVDYAYLAAAYAYLGRTAEAQAAAASVQKLDAGWNAERYLSEGGGYPEKEGELFVAGARKAGLAACVPADKIKAMPTLIRIKSCDAERGKPAG